MSDYMGGGFGNSALYLTNPQLAIALRQQALATPFMQQGADMSPIRSPWQGAARLGNALVGALLYNKSNDQIQQAVSGQNDAIDAAVKDFQNSGIPQQPNPSSAAPISPSAAPIAASPPNAALPRPLRDNNPLAISGMGPAGSDVNQQLGDSVAVYRTPEEGTRAAMALLLKKSGGKPTTINDIVDGWAPGNPKAYKATLSTLTGFDQTQPLDLTQPQIMGKILSGMGRVENGRDLPPGLIASAMAPPTAQAGNVATDAMPPAGMPPAGAGAPVAVAGPGAPTAPTGAPGAAAAMPPTGANSPQIQEAIALQNKATALETNRLTMFDPRAQHLANAYRQRAQLLMGLDTYATGPGGVQINTRTGQIGNAPVPLANYQPDPAHPGIWTSPGQKPFAEPSQRIVNVPGVGAVQSTLGGGAQVVVPQSPSGIAAAQSAAAQGTQSGKTLPTVDSMTRLGTEAATAIGNIDYGLNQLHQAAQGGLPPGKATPMLADAAAWAKSLGIDTTRFGIDPNAVANVQAGAKTLAVLGGRIIQQAIGPDSQITEGKVEAFIHAHPDLANDPNAIEKILGWARSQYVFSNNMAKDAMAHADPQTGMIPAGWRADYAKRFGFAPIYDPLSGEMKQPQSGEGPAEEPPKPQAATTQTPQYREGQTATGPGGKKLVFKGGQWQPM